MTTAPIQIGYCQCGCGHSLSGGSLSYLPYHGRHFYKRKEPKWEVLENGCWKWLLYANNKGYGIWNHAGRSILAHVVLWERRNGPVPAGLELDHLCRNRLCVNPDHLEAVTTTVSYFDCVNFAPLISCPMLVYIGLEDDVCPPETGYALVNALKNCPVELHAHEHCAHDAGAYWEMAQVEAFLAAHLRPVGSGRPEMTVG